MAHNSPVTNQVFDAIVIGGGPAGSTCAYKMAVEGHSVLLLEKAKFPRFHIGESMVSYQTKLLEMMGVLDKIKEAEFVQKSGVEFFTRQTNDLRRQDFNNMAPGQILFAYHFHRARFDKVLLDHAQDTGAQVLQQAEVKKLIFDGERLVGVEYEYQGHRHQAKASYVVDASGRAGLIAKHFHLRKMNDKLQNVAVFQHYKNVVKENNPGLVEGDFLLSSHEDGWVWGIPIETDMFSIGTVMSLSLLKENDPQKIFDTHCSRSPRIMKAIEGAIPVYDKPKIELDYCYHSEQLAGPGYFIVGDAACFVDPLFSGGVYIGMVSGMKAAEAIHNILKGRDEKEARTYFENFCKTGYDSYFRLVYSFYIDFKRDVNRMALELPGGVHFAIQTFAGDFWAEADQPILSYLRSQRKWDTFEQPFEPIYECPVYPDPDTHYRATDISKLSTPENFQSYSVQTRGAAV